MIEGKYIIVYEVFDTLMEQIVFSQAYYKVSMFIHVSASVNILRIDLLQLIYYNLNIQFNFKVIHQNL